MSYGIYLSADGAQAQAQRMEVIANNLANVDTTGFKRQLAVIQARHSEAIEQGVAVENSATIDDIGGGTLVQETLTDFSTGQLKHTGIPSDVAIDGDGFFEVQKDGQNFLTRAGNFIVGPGGLLQTSNGYDVLGAGGSQLGMPADVPWRIRPDGTIVDRKNPGTVFGTLSIVRAQQPGDLVHRGENLFSSLSEPLAVKPGDVNVRSGYLEMSGVKPTTEMMEMIETTRAFEANLRVIQNQDAMVDSLLSRILRSN